MPTTVSFFESVGVVSGVVFGCLMNFTSRKPLLTGIYKHAAYSVIGYFIGGRVDQWKIQKEREYVQILEDYVRLHPEDFVEEAPKKYGDVLLKWYPVR